MGILSEFLAVALIGKEGFTQPILDQKTAGEPCYPQIPYNQGWVLDAQNLFFPGQYLLAKTGKNLIYFMMLHLGNEYLKPIKRQYTIYIKKTFYFLAYKQKHM